MKTRFKPDRGLTSRMVVTSFLLGLLYVGFVALLIALTKSAVLAVVIAGGALFVQYWFSDRIALYAMHGKIVTPEEAPQLHGAIDRLCALADMPKPRVAIADVDLPNAFATGRNPNKAVVCVTTGIMRRLDADELEGVLVARTVPRRASGRGRDDDRVVPRRTRRPDHPLRPVRRPRPEPRSERGHGGADHRPGVRRWSTRSRSC